MGLRIGVVGTGGIASVHLNNIAKMAEIEITALCDSDEKKVNEAATKYGAIPFTDFHTMLEQTDLNALLVCTPPSIRLPVIAEAASKGIACFIEKPPAANMEEAFQILNIIELSGIPAAVGFMWRYSKAVRKAKELISQLPVPLIRSIYTCGVANIPSIPRWFLDKSVSGGPIVDQAIHVLDLCRFLVCDHSGEVEHIHSFGSNVMIPKQKDFTIEDSHVVNLTYGNGAIHSHVHSWAVEPTFGSIELISNEFRLTIDLSSEITLGGHFRNEPVSFAFENEDCRAAEMQAFFRAIETGDRSLILSPYADALETLKVVHAVNRSVDEGSSVRV